MTLGEQKKDFLADLARDRRVWRWLMVPQVLLLLAVVVLLAFVAGFGLYTAVQTFREQQDVDTMKKAVSVFFGGSSSALGFFMFKTLGKLREASLEFMAGERRFTSFCARTKNVAVAIDYANLIKAYEQAGVCFHEDRRD